MMLKRKSEESEQNTVKRVARDSETLEQKPATDDNAEPTATTTTAAEPVEVEHTSVSADVSGIDLVTGSESASANVSQNESSIDVQVGPDAVDTSGTTNGSEAAHASGVDESDHRKAAGLPPLAHRGAMHSDDPSYVHFRMLSTISEAAIVVGKGGETINKIKEISNARVNVSENLKGVPERVISVRGPAEYVAKAFNLIVRMLLDEPLNGPSSAQSKQYNLRLLFPHTVMGYIIGKRGSRFREIEDNSAALLKASDQILPASTDRILNINGVSDAIHIATYYVSQTVLEHKQQMIKTIFYNPANFAQPTIPVMGQSARRFQQQQQQQQQQQHGFRGGRMGPHYPQQGGFSQGMVGMPSQMMNMYSQVPPPPPGAAPAGSPGDLGGQSPTNGKPQMSGYFHPGYGAQFNPVNTRAGSVTTGADGKINQEIFVPQKHIGLVIGRGGRNLKDIRQQTGCYVKINEDIPGSTERKLTLIGNMFGIQNAMLLINNKIENEKMREQRDYRQRHRQQQPQSPIELPPEPQSAERDPEDISEKAES